MTLEYDISYNEKFIQHKSIDELHRYYNGAGEDGIQDLRGAGEHFALITVQDEDDEWHFKASGDPPFQLAVLGGFVGLILSQDSIFTSVDLSKKKLNCSSRKEHGIGDLFNLPGPEVLVLTDQGESLELWEYNNQSECRIKTKASFAWHKEDEKGFHHPCYFERIKKAEGNLLFSVVVDEEDNRFELIHNLHDLTWMNRKAIQKEIEAIEGLPD